MMGLLSGSGYNVSIESYVLDETTSYKLLRSLLFTPEKRLVSLRHPHCGWNFNMESTARSRPSNLLPICEGNAGTSFRNNS